MFSNAKRSVFGFTHSGAAPQWRHAATALALAVTYFIAGKLGLSYASVHSSASAVWPPTGIALAAFLVLGKRAWPAIFVAAFVVNVTTAGSVLTSLGIAAGNTLEAAAGADRGRPARVRSARAQPLSAAVSVPAAARLGSVSLRSARGRHSDRAAHADRHRGDRARPRPIRDGLAQRVAAGAATVYGDARDDGLADRCTRRRAPASGRSARSAARIGRAPPRVAESRVRPDAGRGHRRRGAIGSAGLRE